MKTVAMNVPLADTDQQAGTVDGISIEEGPFFRERHWVMWAKMGVDVLALQLALYLGYLSRHVFDHLWPMQITIEQHHDLILGWLLVPVGYWLMRLYPGYGLSSVERLRRRVQATFVFLLLFIFWDYIFNESMRSRGVLLSAFVFALIVPPIMQSLFREVLIRLNWWGTPVVVLGAARTGEQVVSALMNDLSIGLRPIVVFDDDQHKGGGNLFGVPIVHGLRSANEFAGKARYAIVAIPGTERELQLELCNTLRFHNTIVIPNLIGIQSLCVDARDLGGVIGLHIQKNLLLRRNRVLKRVMDYLLGVPLFILSLPIFALFAVWIRYASPGPAFYCQVREGRDGKKIKVWKLRTMYQDADRLLHEHLASNLCAKREWNQFFKLKDDPRIVKGIGAILRKTSLDELPQLWNVLRGELSLVGPRPFPHYHLEQFNPAFRELRRSVIPGITGFWQVSARSDGDLVVQEHLDTYYIRNWSIWLDLSLLGRTLLIVLTGKGAY